MALTALERLDLSDELDSLLEQAKTAKGLDLLDIGDKVDEVLVKLGYGAAAVSPPPADPEPPKPADVQPEIVTDFLAGKFTTQQDSEFVTTLNTLDQYVGIYLTLDDVKAGAITWVNDRAAVAA
jgi:hypothetical protein